LPELHNEGGKDLRLFLEEEYDLGEPLLGQMFQVSGLLFHPPELFEVYDSGLHHGFE
jgi:hypothetical protein